MNKKETIKMLNKLIDEMIIKGETKSKRYKELIEKHYKLTH
jgi:hypothetical protein